jgi:hypothetical protein
MLEGKEIDRVVTRPSVYQDPTFAESEYPPLLPEYYTTLFMEYTYSNSTKGSRENNPLHCHISKLEHFFTCHSLETPKACLQIHTTCAMLTLGYVPEFVLTSRIAIW